GKVSAVNERGTRRGSAEAAEPGLWKPSSAAVIAISRADEIPHGGDDLVRIERLGEIGACAAGDAALAALVGVEGGKNDDRRLRQPLQPPACFKAVHPGQHE